MTLVSKPADDNTIENRSLKVAIVTRRFWPFSDTSELEAADLAQAIKAVGHTTDILTVRWEKTWPGYFDFREIPIHRISRPAGAPWTSFRYVRNLQRKIQEVRPDGIIVFGIDEEAWAIAKSFAGEVPFVIRLDSHALGVRSGRPNLTSRQISALKAASKILVDSPWTSSRLSEHPAIDSDSIEVVSSLIWNEGGDSELPIPTRAKQATARISISDAHPVLMIEPTQPLVICGSPMDGDPGLVDLVNAWPYVLRHEPKAKLWIIGNGPKSRTVWEKIIELNLVNSVIMPGSFDELEDVFQAADVCVHPLRSDQSCSFLLRAMAAGLCPIVTETANTRSLVEKNVNGLVLLPENPRALAEAIVQALGNVDLRDRLGRAALKSMTNAYDTSQHVERFLASLKSGSGRSTARN